MQKMIPVLLFFIMIPFQTVTPLPNDELIQIHSILSKEDFSTDTWNVIFSEEISTQTASKLKQKMENSYLVTVHEDINRIKYKMNFKTSSKNSINYHLELIIPKHHHEKPTITAFIYGTSWDEKTLNVYNKIKANLLSAYFSERHNMFTCVKIPIDDIINRANFNKKINEIFKVKYKNVQFDKSQQNINKEIIYGYTNLWDRMIKVENEPMNIQIVIKEMKNRHSHMIVGTPILMNEY